MGGFGGAISTASRVGTITATLTVGTLLRIMDWRHMLWVSSAIGGVLILLVLFLVREKPPHQLLVVDNTLSEDLSHPFFNTTLKKAFIIMLLDKRFILIAASMMGLTILWDFLNFVPLYLNESLNISTADAAMATASFPVGSLISVLIGGFFFDSLSKKFASANI